MNLQDNLKEQIEAALAPLRGRDGALIPALQAVQGKVGYLPEEAMEEIGKTAGVSANTAYGVASFYAQFRFRPPGAHTCKICLGTACHVRGAAQIVETIEREFGVQEGDITADGKLGLETVRCFGSCALAPVVVVDEAVYGRMTSSKAKQVLDQL